MQEESADSATVDSATADTGDDTAGQDTSTDSVAPDEGEPEAVPLYGGPPVDPAACDAAAAKLGDLVTADACAAIVRVAYDTLTVLGWQLRCDAPAAFTEASARKELAPYVAPVTTLDSYSWKPSGDGNPWVLFRSPGDFGGVGVGSFQTGKLIFAGGVVWAGRGDIAYPSAFRSVAELAMPCPPFAWAKSPDGFMTASEMTDSKSTALAVALRTAIPYALAKKHVVKNAWVLGYARTVGGFDPKGAEWIVVLESAK